MTEIAKKTQVGLNWIGEDGKELTLEQMLRKCPVCSDYLKNIGLNYAGMSDRVKPKKAEGEADNSCLPESR